MDLKQYKQHIRDQLLHGVKNQIEIDKRIQDGVKLKGKGIKPKQTEDLDIFSDLPIRARKPGGLLNPKLAKKVRELQKSAIPTINMDDDNEEIHGGKFNFVKSISHATKDIGNVAKTASKAVVNEVIKQGSKEAGKAIVESAKTTAKGFMASAPELATAGEVAGETVAENPELVLLAAGMKKKRTRRVSEKEMNRHKLIRQLMDKYDISLCEASKIIKQKNLKY